MMWLATTGYLKAQKWLKDFHRDRKGVTAIEAVLWIAVAILILVAVVGLVNVIWAWMTNEVPKVIPGTKGKIPPISQ